MPNFTPNQLKAVAAANRLRSISRAAKELGLTQPAISKAIQELETGIGHTLFDRIRGGVKPSARGMKKIQIIEQILSIQHEISAELANTSRKAQKIIRIGATIDISARVMESIFKCLSLFFSIDTYKFRLIHGEDISRLLADDELDCAVFAACTIEGPGRSTPVIEADFGFLHSPKIGESKLLSDDIKRLVLADRSTANGRNSCYKIISLADSPHRKETPLIETEHIDFSIRFLHSHPAAMLCTGLEAAREDAEGLFFTPVEISNQLNFVHVGVPRGPANIVQRELLREVVINGILNAPWRSCVRPFVPHRGNARDST